MDPPKSFIKRIITNLIWEPIFSTQDLEQYIKAKGILLDKGIPIKTKITNRSGGFTHSERSGYIKNTYEIKVKPESVHQANAVLHDSVI
jgi:hypothetical protein